MVICCLSTRLQNLETNKSCKWTWVTQLIFMSWRLSIYQIGMMLLNAMFKSSPNVGI